MTDATFYPLLEKGRDASLESPFSTSYPYKKFNSTYPLSLSLINSLTLITLFASACGGVTRPNHTSTRWPRGRFTRPKAYNRPRTVCRAHRSARWPRRPACSGERSPSQSSRTCPTRTRSTRRPRPPATTSQWLCPSISKSPKPVCVQLFLKRIIICLCCTGSANRVRKDSRVLGTASNNNHNIGFCTDVGSDEMDNEPDEAPRSIATVKK